MGQEQDSLGGFFDENQAFSGEMTQVEMWSLKLDDLTIKSISDCQQETAFIQSRVVTWNSTLDEWTENNVNKSILPLDNFCQIQVLNNYLIWANPVTYPQISDYCRRVEGTLPEIDTDPDDILKR